MAVLIGLACIRLGFWQLDRLAERRRVNASARAQLELPPISLPQALAESDDLEYRRATADRKSTRLNSSHQIISYAVFCLDRKSVV